MLLKMNCFFKIEVLIVVSEFFMESSIIVSIILYIAEYHKG